MTNTPTHVTYAQTAAHRADIFRYRDGDGYATIVAASDPDYATALQLIEQARIMASVTGSGGSVYVDDRSLLSTPSIRRGAWGHVEIPAEWFFEPFGAVAATDCMHSTSHSIGRGELGVKTGEMCNHCGDELDFKLTDADCDIVLELGTRRMSAISELARECIACGMLNDARRWLDEAERVQRIIDTHAETKRRIGTGEY